MGMSTADLTFRVYNGPTGHEAHESVNDCLLECRRRGWSPAEARYIGKTASAHIPDSSHAFVTGYEGKTRQCRRCARFERVVS